jgi:hypothetical protein
MWIEIQVNPKTAFGRKALEALGKVADPFERSYGNTYCLAVAVDTLHDAYILFAELGEQAPELAFDLARTVQSEIGKEVVLYWPRIEVKP